MPWGSVKVISKRFVRSKPDIVSYDTVKVELEMSYATWKRLRLLIEAPDAYDKEQRKTSKSKKR